ncbi:stress protein [Streptomyces sp. NPDC004539]|uniref:stress protein n=1 Tax=Streptomyces sp. NPDC004539 TaxID=3154280 RepID=UPI0033AE3BFF
MNRPHLRTSLVALPLVTAALLSAVALPAHAANPSVERPVAIAADAPTPKVSVHMDKGAHGVRVAEAISKIKEKNRGEFVKKAVNAAFMQSGRRYNVVIMNLSQDYDERLQGERLYANIRYGSINYGLWIADKGKFANKGDGGYINWGFRGWFKRDGMTVTFRRP